MYARLDLPQAGIFFAQRLKLNSFSHLLVSFFSFADIFRLVFGFSLSAVLFVYCICRLVARILFVDLYLI